jgi:uncharacterized membrane protein YccC
MFEFITEALLMPRRVWFGTILGVIVASFFWYFLPESVDRGPIAMWSIVIGFLVGLISSFVTEKNDKRGV